jgi:diguanylate cyclase (GGDEF)-like protein
MDAGSPYTRIAELETELAEAHRQNGVVFVLQQVLAMVAASLDLDDLLTVIVHGIGEALGFPRVVIFDRDESGEITPRLMRSTEGTVTGGYSLAFALTDDLKGIAEGRSELVLGDTTVKPSPLADARGSFCMVPLVARERVQGLIYIDRPSSREFDEFEVGMLLIFASQAAISIDDARSIAHTQQLAITDPLTGITNRRGFEFAVERDLIQARRVNEQRGFLIFDLDGFKQINDTQGHTEGDRVLREFSTLLSATARGADIVARYAGDEFVAVLHKADRDLTERAAARILHALNNAGFRCSIGGAVFPQDGGDWTSLFASADLALYQAKANGRNQFVIYDGSRRDVLPAS